jgi:hypothetical protein
MQIIAGLVSIVDMWAHIQNRPRGTLRYESNQHRPERPPRPLDFDHLFSIGGTFKPSEYLLNGTIAPKLHKIILRQSKRRNNPAFVLAKYDVRIYPAAFLDKTTGPG